MYAYNFWQKVKQSKVVLSDRYLMVKETTKTLKAIENFSIVSIPDFSIFRPNTGILASEES